MQANFIMNKALIQKYNVPGPRYTSYPTVPFWNSTGIAVDSWKTSVQRSFEESKEQGIRLYIHLPFCESLCTFCGCHKHITVQHGVEEPYIDTVLKEWQLYLELLPDRPVIREIHLGGGTPTFFAPEELERLITGILDGAEKHDEFELGFEGHPNNTSIGHLETLYRLGSRRVSFGVQDYDPLVQRAINRVQPFRNVENVHRVAKAIGYKSISHDLVFGLPHQTMEMILETVHLTNKLRPDRISLYSYAHVPWVKGTGQRGFEKKDLPKDADKRALYVGAKAALEKHGYHEVGMDHFALETDELYKAFKKGTLHRNFMGYTTNTTQLMIGLGMSSISDSWYAFAQNAKTVKEYTDLVEAGTIPIFRGHELTEEDLVLRRHILDLMCGFRTEWDEAFEMHEEFQNIMERLDPLISDGLCTIEGRELSVSELGRTFVRNICMCFDLHLYRAAPKEQVFSRTI